VHIVVVGAGPAGLAAASEILRTGHAATVVESAEAGGNAVFHSLVPSKVLIEAAAADPHHPAAWAGWMARQRRVVAAVAARAREEIQGARLVRGSARLSRRNDRVEVVVGDMPIPADGIILATGSQQVLVPGAAPDGRRILLPRAFAALEAPPPALAVVGAGPTGLEAAALFARVGSRVTLFTPHERLLPDWSWDISAGLKALYGRLGVDIFYGERIERLEVDGAQIRLYSGRSAFTAPAVFLATGRRPAASPDEYAEVGLATDAAGFLAVDRFGRTSVDGVWAAGDAAGMPLLANKARWQGRTAARSALGLPLDPAVSPPAFVEAVYTHPDAARVGRTPGRGLDPGATVWLARPTSLTYRLALEAVEDVPVVCLVYTAGPRGAVLGAEAFGPRAADLLAPVALAVAEHLTLDQLTRLPAASPTIAEWLGDLVPMVGP
jgi:pyruvate/2-oxoglutarate dehydrogenase complex dihydrolipoamide dehydrogenase (E3) component